MAILNFTDSLIAFVTVLSQFVATVLFIEHGNWGEKIVGGASTRIVAGVTVAHLSFLYVVLRWRSKREVGYDLGCEVKTIVRLSAMGLFTLINLGFEENTLEKKLWVCALVYIAVFGLFALTRAVRLPDSVIQYLLFSAIFKTEGHLFWRYGFGVLMAVVPLVGHYRESWLMRARKEAERLKKPLLEG